MIGNSRLLNEISRELQSITTNDRECHTIGRQTFNSKSGEEFQYLKNNYIYSIKNLLQEFTLQIKEPISEERKLKVLVPCTTPLLGDALDIIEIMRDEK